MFMQVPEPLLLPEQFKFNALTLFKNISVLWFGVWSQLPPSQHM